MSKHPKERMIPRTLLKYKAFKRFEDKVILGLHVFELTLILLIAAITASMATFLPKAEVTSTTTQTESVVTPVVDDEEGELRDTAGVGGSTTIKM